MKTQKEKSIKQAIQLIKATKGDGGADVLLERVVRAIENLKK